MTVRKLGRITSYLFLILGVIVVSAALVMPQKTHPTSIPSYVLAPPSITATPATEPGEVDTSASTSRAEPARNAPAPEPEPAPQSQPAPEPVPEPEPVPQTGPETVWLEPVTAIRDQGVVDEGHLVTWMTDPTCLLAGHDYAGWAWMSSVPVGTLVEVTAGPCAGSYEVYDHNGHDWRGGPVPEWMNGVDLVLQTCTPNGTGFSLARSVP